MKQTKNKIMENLTNKEREIINDYLSITNEEHAQRCMNQDMDGSGECGKFIWAGYDEFEEEQRMEAIKEIQKINLDCSEKEIRQIIAEIEFGDYDASSIEGVEFNEALSIN